MDQNIFPILKSTVQFYRIGNNSYFKTSGSAVEFEDPLGVIAALCELMNGRRNIKELREILGDRYPTAGEHVLDVINVLDDSYLLDDARTLPTNMNDYELKRWSRNFEFFGAYCRINENKYDHQKKLKDTKVVILGLGGLGSHIVYDLVALGVLNIRAVDFDRIELSNLNRHLFYREDDIGKLKTEAMQAQISEFCKPAKIEFINKKIESMQDIEYLIKGHDIVICVADKPRVHIQHWLNSACFRLGIPFITGGLDTKQAAFFSVMPGQDGCVECWKNSIKDNPIAHQILENEYKAGESAIPAPAIVPLVSILTGLIVSEFLKIITGLSQRQAASRLLSYDFDTAQILRTENWYKAPECYTCSSLVTLKKCKYPQQQEL